MKPHRKSLPQLITLALLIVIALASCSGQVRDTLSGTEPPGSGNEASSLNQPALMGTVLDLEGQPMAFVDVSDAGITNFDGLYSGDLKVSGSTWIAINYPGYATSFAQPFLEMNGTWLFEARTTPFQDMISMQAADRVTLAIFGTEEIRFQADLSELPPDSGVNYVGLALIDPLYIEAAYAPVDGGPGLWLQTAFALQGFDNIHKAVDLPAGVTLSIKLYDVNLATDETLFAYFDDLTGVWTPLDRACEHTEIGVLACKLTHFSGLFGFFTADAPVIPDLASGPTSATMTILGSLINHGVNKLQQMRAPTTNTDGGFQQAYKAILDWLKGVEDSGASTVDLDDPTLNKLLDNLSKAAKNFAKGNRNEAGKYHLLKAAATLMSFGRDAQGLLDEAGDISREMAEEIEDETDCKRFMEIDRRAAQLSLLGKPSDDGLIDKLGKKIEEMVKECDVWTGTITVSMPISSTHPGGLDMRVVGGGLWMERHRVTMTTNVKTLELRGFVEASINFPEVLYRRDKECKNEIRFYGQPSGINTSFTFDGTYDGYSFALGPLSNGTRSLNIVQKHHFESKQDEICETVTDATYPFPNYESVLAHGFEYGEIPITIQKMVEGGGEQDSITGHTTISNPNPDQGKYPFMQAGVSWNFMHTQKKLPIEE